MSIFLLAKVLGHDTLNPKMIKRTLEKKKSLAVLSIGGETWRSEESTTSSMQNLRWTPSQLGHTFSPAHKFSILWFRDYDNPAEETRPVLTQCRFYNQDRSFFFSFLTHSSHSGNIQFLLHVRENRSYKTDISKRNFWFTKKED